MIHFQILFFPIFFVCLGSISFDTVDLENDFVLLVNERTSGREVSLKNWTIRRKNDQQPEIIYQFPSSFGLQPRQTIQILSRQTPLSARSSRGFLLANNVNTWGKGQSMVTRLIDEDNEQKAIITQTFQQ